MEKNIKKMSMCVKLSHLAVQQRLAQYCNSTVLQLKKEKRKEKKKKAKEKKKKHERTRGKNKEMRN